MNKKILILDGISGVPMGKEINEALQQLNISSHYTAAIELKHRFFYKPASAFNKMIHKHIYNEDYYRHPKISNQALEDLIKETKPDIIFVIGFLYRFFDLELIQQLKQEAHFKLYLYDTDSCNLFNNKRELVYFFNQELPVYDHIFSFSKTTTEFINKLSNLNASYFPFGAKDIPVIKAKKENDILFVGSADMRRIFLLEHLVDHNLCVYGSKWQRNNDVMSDPLKSTIHYQSIWGNELHTLLHQSKIILNITRSTFYGVETGLNLRIFETLAAGGFLLTDYCDELNELFVIGKHIETYRDAEEMTDKIRYYLQHEEKRIKIAQNAYQHYQNNYSWKIRMQKLLSSF